MYAWVCGGHCEEWRGQQEGEKEDGGEDSGEGVGLLGGRALVSLSPGGKVIIITLP